MTQTANAGNVEPRMGTSGHGHQHLVILLLTSLNASAEQLENMVTVWGILHRDHNVTDHITSFYLLLKQHNIEQSALTVQRKQSFWPGPCRQPLQAKIPGHLDRKIALCCLITMTLPLLCLSYSVQSSSQRLTKYRCGKKRTSVHPRKMPLYSHKATVCAMHCHENGA